MDPVPPATVEAGGQNLTGEKNLTDTPIGRRLDIGATKKRKVPMDSEDLLTYVRQNEEKCVAIGARQLARLRSFEQNAGEEIERLKRKVNHLRSKNELLEAQNESLKSKMNDDQVLTRKMQTDLFALHQVASELTEFSAMSPPACLKDGGRLTQWSAFMARNREIMQKVKDKLSANLPKGLSWKDVVKHAMAVSLPGTEKTSANSVYGQREGC